MPGELAAGEQLRSQRREKSRRNLIESHADAVGRTKVWPIGGKNTRVGLVDTEGNGIGIGGGLHAGQLLNGLQHLLLEGAATLFGVSSQVQLERRGHNVLGLEPEIHLQGVLKATQRQKGSRDENKAEGYLHDDKQVAES